MSQAKDIAVGVLGVSAVGIGIAMMFLLAVVVRLLCIAAAGAAFFGGGYMALDWIGVI